MDTLKTQPLSVLYASGDLKNLKHEIIQSGKLKVSMVGVPYTENINIKTLNIPPKGDAQVQLCLMHLYASPKGGKLFKEKIYGYEELAVLGCSVYVIGHDHSNKGIVLTKGKYFVNLGSISRGTIAEENINHKPSFGLIKITLEDEKVNITATEIPLKIKPVEEVFDLKKHEEEKKESLEIQKFVDRLITETSSEIGKKLSINQMLEKMTLSKKIKDTVINLIAEAATNKKLTGVNK